MRLFFNSISLALILFFGSNQLLSQTDIKFDLSSGYDDNVFLSPEPQSDFITDASISFKFHPRDTALSYFLNSNYFSYLNNSDRNMFINNVGFNYYKRIGTGNNYVFYGTDWLNRLNKEEYNYYNYNQLSGYINLMFKFDRAILKTGYNLRYRDYSDLKELTNYQQYLFAHYNRSFQTRTTLILESNVGLKTFRGLESYTSGSGRGRNSFTQIIDGENSNLGHVVLLGRVAQSIGNKTGVFIQYRQQIGILNTFDYSNSEDFYQDEELFDDPFSYESSSFSTQISFLLPKNFMLRTGGVISYKNYISELAYESAEDSIGTGSLREDIKNTIYMNITKEYFPKKSWYKSIKIYAGYNLIANKSNSYWYDYNNNSYNLGILLTF